MGFFDKLFGKEGVEMFKEEEEEKAPKNNLYSGKYDIRRELPGILAGSFAEYELTQGVDAASFGSAAEPSKPYDYCLSIGGTPKAVIMLTDHNRNNNRAFLNAREAANNAGIPFINFFTHMPNNPEYVVARIASFLG